MNKSCHEGKQNFNDDIDHKGEMKSKKWILTQGFKNLWHKWNILDMNEMVFMDALANTYLITWGEHFLLQFGTTCFK